MKRWLRHAVLITLDLLSAATSIILAFIIIFDGSIPTLYLNDFARHIVFFITLRLLVLAIFGIYKSLWRYASVREVLLIIVAVASGSALIFAFQPFMGVARIPFSIYVVEALLFLLFTGGTRYLVRLRRYFILKKPNLESKQVLIVGAGDAGVMLLNEFINQPMLGINVVGFIDDDPSKQNRNINGISVLGPRNKLIKIASKYKIDQIIIAMPSVTSSIIQETIDISKETKAELKILPPINEIIDRKVSAKDVRDVKIEDLLRREAIQTDLSGIKNFLKGKCILVTGAGGSIGRELCRQICLFKPDRLILLGHGENSIFEIDAELKSNHPKIKLNSVIADVRNEKRMEKVFSVYKPNVVFHAAAHKYVPLMEENVEEAVTNNIFGTQNLTYAADKYETECFVMVSSDKAVNPGNIMGATKRAAELIVMDMAKRSKTRFVSVRFGNVLGSRGSVIPLFSKQIENGGPITITDPNMSRYFMTIPEAVQLILQSGAMGEGGEIFVLQMGTPVKILDLAKDLIRLSGLEFGKDIDIVYTGSRPGEKIEEELVSADEVTEETLHKEIIKIPRNGINRITLHQALDKIKLCLQKDDMEELVTALYKLVGKEVPVYLPVVEEESAKEVAASKQGG